MSGRIKGITVEIGGDTTKLQKALQGVEKNIGKVADAVKGVSNKIKSFLHFSVTKSSYTVIVCK